jgi:hypothetical protein
MIKSIVRSTFQQKLDKIKRLAIIYSEWRIQS